MTSENQETQVEIILERVKYIQESMKGLIESVKCLTDAQQHFLQEYIKAHTIIEQKTTAAHDRLDDHEDRLDTLEKAIQPLILANKLLIWIGGILGVSIITLIWMLITQQVQIIWP